MKYERFFLSELLVLSSLDLQLFLRIVKTTVFAFETHF